MANIIDKFLNSMKLNDDDEYDDEYDYDPNENGGFDDTIVDDLEDPDIDGYGSRDRDARRPSRREEKSASKDARPAEREHILRTKKDKGADNVVPFRARTGGGNMEVCMLKPNTFEDSVEICNVLLDGRAALINLEGIDPSVSQRIIDFTAGACYSMNGKIKMVSSYIVMASPKSIELSGDFSDNMSM